MNTFARFFGCTSVIALGGLTAASSMLACSSDDAANPAGDDDDDQSSSSSSSSGSSGKSSTSSSTSSSSSGSAATCDPSGTYAFGAPVWSGEGGICPDFAKSLNTGQDPATYEYKKTATGFDEQDVAGGAPNPMKVIDDPSGQCALTGAQSLDNIGVKDQDGNTVKANLRGITLVVFEGNTAVYSSKSELKAVTGAPKGLPCQLSFETTGTKK